MQIYKTINHAVAAYTKSPIYTNDTLIILFRSLGRRRRHHRRGRHRTRERRHWQGHPSRPRTGTLPTHAPHHTRPTHHTRCPRLSTQQARRPRMSTLQTRRARVCKHRRTKSKSNTRRRRYRAGTIRCRSSCARRWWRRRWGCRRVWRVRVWTHGTKSTRDRSRCVWSRCTLDDPSVTLSDDAPSIYVDTMVKLSTRPFTFDTCRFGSNESWCRVRTGNCFDGTPRDTKEIRCTSEDTANDTDTPGVIVQCQCRKSILYVPNKKLNQRRRTLVDCDDHRIQVKLEENARGALVVTQFANVVCDAVLVRVERCGAWCNVSSRHHMEEVLVRHERCE